MATGVRRLLGPLSAALVVALLAAAVVPWTPLRDKILDVLPDGSTASHEGSLRLDVRQCIVVAKAKGYDVTYLERVLALEDRPEEALREEEGPGLLLLEWLLDTCRQITR